MTQSPIQFRQGEQKTGSLLLALGIVGIYMLSSIILSMVIFYFSFQNATEDIHESDDTEIQAPSPIIPDVTRSSVSNLDDLLIAL